MVFLPSALRACQRNLLDAISEHPAELDDGSSMKPGRLAVQAPTEFLPPASRRQIGDALLDCWSDMLAEFISGALVACPAALPTITFRLLYCAVILRHGRRLWVSFGVTANPTAEWISRQITEAFPRESAPHYLIRGRDTAYGPVFVQRLRAMGIRDRPIAPRSP
jgi:hypothetical protein